MMDKQSTVTQVPHKLLHPIYKTRPDHNRLVNSFLYSNIIGVHYITYRGYLNSFSWGSKA
jgi:hypothetical protein